MKVPQDYFNLKFLREFDWCTFHTTTGSQIYFLRMHSSVERSVQSLRDHGVAVLPCISSGLVELRTQFLHVLRTLPELRDDVAEPGRVPAFGGFGALGLPSSFHHPFIRALRRTAYEAAAPFFEAFLEELPGLKLEQLIDRVQLRQPGTSPTAEAFHRDLSVYGPGCSAADGDHFFGGWINLDTVPQQFSCVLGSHVPGQNSSAHGFSMVTSKEEKEAYKAARTAVQIPPGHMIVFYSNIVHEVVARKSKDVSARMYCCWRLTPGSTPMYDDFLERMTRQDVIPLPSRQEPPMHAKLHWTNWREELEQWSTQMIKDELLVTREVASGKRKGETVRVVPLVLKNSGQHYPAYTQDELSTHRPHIVKRARIQ